MKNKRIMKLTFGNYTPPYIPKTDSEHYAYYIDTTNYEIVKTMISQLDIDKDILEEKLYYYNKYESKLPFVMYFERNTMSYDFVVNNSWAVFKKYTIIKLQRSLINME